MRDAFSVVANILIYGFAIASLVGLLFPFFKINLKGHTAWWWFQILPFSLVLAAGLERLGVIRCLEKLLSN